VAVEAEMLTLTLLAVTLVQTLAVVAVALLTTLVPTEVELVVLEL
jgi:hypothetical protein